MNCINCGAELEKNVKTCPACGKEVECSEAPASDVAETVTEAPKKKGIAFGYLFAGMLLPMLGLVLFILDKNVFPDKARSAGIGAIIGCALSVLSVVLLVGGYFGFIFIFMILAVLAGL